MVALMVLGKAQKEAIGASHRMLMQVSGTPNIANPSGAMMMLARPSGASAQYHFYHMFSENCFFNGRSLDVLFNLFVGILAAVSSRRATSTALQKPLLA